MKVCHLVIRITGIASESVYEYADDGEMMLRERRNEIIIILGVILNMKRLKTIVLIVFISQLFFSACGLSKNIVKNELENSKRDIPNKDAIITAYINAINKMQWQCVDSNNTYDLIKKQESLDGPANCKIYVSKENGDVSKKDKYNLDFIYLLENNDDGVYYSSWRIGYYPEFSCFTSEFIDGGPSSGSYEDVQKELNDIGVDFLCETVIKFPRPFIPEIKMTEKKEIIIKKIRSQVEELSKNIYGRGKYKAYIWDFSDADTETKVLITNPNKKIMAEYPLIFYDDKGDEDIHVPLGVHVDIEETMDYDVGSIKYYELFQMFSVKTFDVNVNI